MTRPRFTWRQRLRYAFDNTLAQGTWALIGWLVVASAIFVVLTAVLVQVTGTMPADRDGVVAPMTLSEQMWNNLMRAMDAGTMGGDHGTRGYLFIMLLVSIGGVFIVGTLIAVMANGVRDRIEALRAGRSVVAERDHVLILGWNPQIFSIIGELALGSAHRRRNRIVILADRDPVAMTQEIRDRLPRLLSTRVVCRRGVPTDRTDLARVSFDTARAIIILSTPGVDPDAEVIRSLLAICNHPTRRPEPFHLIAEIKAHRNLAPARLAGRGEVYLIEVGDVIARVIAQTCRQTGLSTVYTELLDYDGDEIYFTDASPLVGVTFAEGLQRFPASALIGVQTTGGSVLMNPPMTRRFEPGEQAIVIARELTAARTGPGPTALEARWFVEREPARPVAERTLLIGWNAHAPVIVRELDSYVASGSVLTVVSDEAEVGIAVEAMRPHLQRLQLAFHASDATDREVLEALEPGSYAHIIVLAHSDTRPAPQADAATIVTLLHLRDIEARTGSNRYSIVTEMLDVRNRELAEVMQADDFIVSERLTSLLIAQVAENRSLGPVFEDLFDADGSEIYLKPAADYVVLDQPLTFRHVVASASRRGHVAIGYRLESASHDARRNYGVVVNPPKEAEVRLAAGDRVIVLAEG